MDRRSLEELRSKKRGAVVGLVIGGVLSSPGLAILLLMLWEVVSGNYSPGSSPPAAPGAGALGLLIIYFMVYYWPFLLLGLLILLISGIVYLRARNHMGEPTAKR